MKSRQARMTWERFRLLVSRYPLSLPHIVHGVSPSPSHLVQVGDGCRAIEVELVLPGAAIARGVALDGPIRASLCSTHLARSYSVTLAAMVRTTTKAQPARTAVLTQKDLARVIGGTEGTIIVENVVKVPQGIQGSG